jgi:hypothetical protein
MELTHRLEQKKLEMIQQFDDVIAGITPGLPSITEQENERDSLDWGCLDTGQSIFNFMCSGFEPRVHPNHCFPLFIASIWDDE